MVLLVGALVEPFHQQYRSAIGLGQIDLGYLDAGVARHAHRREFDPAHVDQIRVAVEFRDPFAAVVLDQRLGPRAADAATVEKVRLERTIHFLAGVDVGGDVLQVYEALERPLRRRPHRVVEICGEVQRAHPLARRGEQELDLGDWRRLPGLGQPALAPLVGPGIEHYAEHRGRLPGARFDVNVTVQWQVDRIEREGARMIDVGFRVLEPAELVVDDQLTGKHDVAVAEVRVNKEFLWHQISNSSLSGARGERARLRIALRPSASPRVSSPGAMTRSNAVGNPSTSSSAR